MCLNSISLCFSCLSKKRYENSELPWLYSRIMHSPLLTVLAVLSLRIHRWGVTVISVVWGRDLSDSFLIEPRPPICTLFKYHFRTCIIEQFEVPQVFQPRFKWDILCHSPNLYALDIGQVANITGCLTCRLSPFAHMAEHFNTSKLRLRVLSFTIL